MTEQRNNTGSEPLDSTAELVLNLTRAEHEELMALVEKAHADQLALASVLDADDKLAEAAKQITMLTAQVATLTSRKNGLMNEANDLKGIIKKRDSQIKKLNKHLAPYVVKLDSGGMPV